MIQSELRQIYSFNSEFQAGLPQGYSTSQSYKIKINLSKYSAVVTREIYLDNLCTVGSGNYLGNLIYKYDVKRVDEERYDTNFIGASFKPGNDVTILNTHPNFCGLTWVAGSEQDVWKKTCVISGADKIMLTLKEEIFISPDDTEISVSFDNLDLIFTKFNLSN